MEVLLLAGSDVSAMISMAEAVEAVHRAFVDLAEGKAAMPPKTYLQFPRHQGDLRVMPASSGEIYAGVKIVNSHALNPERGLPAIFGTYMLISQETGLPLSILEATYLTAVRTGAASAVATRSMARRDSSRLGLVGSGVQARFQLRALAQVLEVGEVAAWAPPQDRERLDAFLRDMGVEFPSISFRPAQTVEEAAAADVVCTTTPVREPIVPDLAIGPGTHINAVGADGPGKQELDPAILKRSRIVVDEWEQAAHAGEINVPLSEGFIDRSDVAGSLAEVVTGRLEGRLSDDEVTVFDSTGLAIEDIAIASVVYERALEAGAGSKVEL